MPGMPGTTPPGPLGSACRPPRICSSCTRAAICWATRAAWMPWNRPSSQPTSWACAIRSSRLARGPRPRRTAARCRSSSSRSSGARPSSSSTIDRSWISAQPVPAGLVERRGLTSSSNCLIMLPIRITLAGCSTRRVGSSPWPSVGLHRADRTPVRADHHHGAGVAGVARGRARRSVQRSALRSWGPSLPSGREPCRPGPTHRGRTARAGRATVAPCLSTRAPC